MEINPRGEPLITTELQVEDGKIRIFTRSDLEKHGEIAHTIRRIQPRYEKRTPELCTKDWQRVVQQMSVDCQILQQEMNAIPD